jgi:hypothetical protein
MKKIFLGVGLSLLLTTATFAVTAATVNGVEISVEEANNALKLLSKGTQTKTWKTLSETEKKQLIQMMAPGKLVAQAAKKELTQKEKEAAMASFWMQKKMMETGVSESELTTAYQNLEASLKQSKSKQKLPPFAQLRNNLQMKIAQEKVVSGLMKTAKIKLK